MNHYHPFSKAAGNTADAENTRAFLQQAVDHYPATFEDGGVDDISQCLLGLVGLGIPGTAEQIATPVSRFLALLGIMRLPTRNAEGIRQLVSLLAPETRATVISPDPVKVPVENRSGLGKASRVSLSQRATLGRTGKEACSRILPNAKPKSPAMVNVTSAAAVAEPGIHRFARPDCTGLVIFYNVPLSSEANR